MDRKDDVRHLNSFLRGEMSAVETYDQALKKLLDEPDVIAPLRMCRSSHQRRVDLLRSEIHRLGGQAAGGSGLWGGFAKLLEGGATVFGKNAAIAALEKGEDHGRDDYRRDLSDLSPGTHDFVQAHLIPEQLRTHETISSLMRQS